MILVNLMNWPAKTPNLHEGDSKVSTAGYLHGIKRCLKPGSLLLSYRSVVSGPLLANVGYILMSNSLLIYRHFYFAYLHWMPAHIGTGCLRARPQRSAQKKQNLAAASSRTRTSSLLPPTQSLYHYLPELAAAPSIFRRPITSQERPLGTCSLREGFDAPVILPLNLAGSLIEVVKKVSVASRLPHCFCCQPPWAIATNILHLYSIISRFSARPGFLSDSFLVFD